MPVLTELLAAIGSGRLELVDLTAPLTATTPVLKLPEPFANTIPFRLEEISRYDERGPRWYWNDIHTGEHTGTHMDAPEPLGVRQGRKGHLAGSAAHPGRARRGARRRRPRRGEPGLPAAKRPTCCAWVDEHGPLPEGGWLLYRTGWDARSADQDQFLNADDAGSHTPGVSAECAQWLAEETPIAGLGRGNGRHRRGRRARARSAVPLPPLPARRRQVRVDPVAEPRLAAGHRRGAGRLAAADRRRFGQPGPGARTRRTRGLSDGCRAPGRHDARPARRRTRRSAWWAAETSRSPTRCAPKACRSSATRHEGGAATMADAYARMSGRVAVRDHAPGLRVHQRADRHRRGGEESDPADRAHRGHRERCGAVELPHRPGRGWRAAVGAVAERVYSAADRPRRHRPRLHARPCASAGRSCSTCRWTCRCSGPTNRARSAHPSRSARSARTPRRSPRSPTRSRGRVGRCSWPAGARGTRQRNCARWPSGRVRCWRHRPWRTGCSTTSRGRWASPAASRRRWPPS